MVTTACVGMEMVGPGDGCSCAESCRFSTTFEVGILRFFECSYAGHVIVFAVFCIFLTLS